MLLQAVARDRTERRPRHARRAGRRGAGRRSIVPARRAPAERIRAAPSRARREPIARDAACNGCGGFTADGREYVITARAAAARRRAPWCNVLANPALRHAWSSESGSAYTWGENAHEFRLTPWHNDPVSDASGEAFYLRDEDSGQVLVADAAAVSRRRPVRTRHGFGYSVFEHIEDGIAAELWVYVAIDAPVKFCGAEAAQPVRPLAPDLSSTGYVEWVLGDLRDEDR